MKRRRRIGSYWQPKRHGPLEIQVFEFLKRPDLKLDARMQQLVRICPTCGEEFELQRGICLVYKLKDGSIEPTARVKTLEIRKHCRKKCRKRANRRRDKPRSFC